MLAKMMAGSSSPLELIKLAQATRATISGIQGEDFFLFMINLLPDG